MRETSAFSPPLGSDFRTPSLVLLLEIFPLVQGTECPTDFSPVSVNANAVLSWLLVCAYVDLMSYGKLEKDITGLPKLPDLVSVLCI